MIRTLLFAIMMVVALGGGLLSPFGALLGYIWFALFRPQEWVWIDISAFRFSLVLGVLLIARSAMAGRWPNLTHRNSLAMLGVLVAALIAQQGAVSPDIAWQWVDFFARLTIVTLLLVTLVDSPRRLCLTVLTIASSFGFHTSKAGLASTLGGGVQYMAGLAGAFLDNNGYAIGAVMILPLLWATARMVSVEWPRARWLSYGYYAAMPLTVFTVISTFSRAGFLALAAAVGASIALSRRRLGMLAVVLVAGLAILPLAPIPRGYFSRLQTIQTYEAVGDTSALGRLHFWSVAWNMAQDHPLGVGLFNFEANYDAYDFLDGAFGTKRSVHNSHLQMLTETGFAGFLLWTSLFIGSLWTCFRIRRRSARELAGTPDGLVLSTMSNAFIVSMTAFLVGGTFIAMGLNDLTWLTFGLVAALDRISAKIFASKVAPVARV